MRRKMITIAAMAAGLAGQAWAQAPAAEPFQVIRPGDRQMSCEVLIAEINGTNAQMASRRVAAMEQMMGAANRMVTSTMATSAATSMVGGVASMIPMGSTLLNAAVKAKQAADVNSLTSQTMDAQRELMSESDVQARLDHLNRLYESKQC